jgi:heme oxygenase (biliverdin-producing, ferredoxin)
MVVSDVDFTLAAGTLLRVGTKTVHDVLSEGAGPLTRGELDKDEYIRYLMMLWHIYR